MLHDLVLRARLESVQHFIPNVDFDEKFLGIFKFVFSDDNSGHSVSTPVEMGGEHEEEEKEICGLWLHRD